MGTFDAYRQRLVQRDLLKDPELLLTDPAGFGLRTATPVQRACSWLFASKPIPDRLWEHADVQEAFGGTRPFATADWECDEFGILSGVRGAKTTLAAVGAVYATQNIELSTGPGAHMLHGEVPRVSVVSERSDLAEVAYGYIRGAVLASPALRDLLVGDPNSDSLLLRHPSGRPIEVCVVAGSRAGASLVARWSAGVIFDEAPRMASESDSVVNLKDMVNAVRSRMLDGAFIAYVGSPYGNVGYVYELFQQNWEKAAPKVFFVRCQGPKMNPVWWTEERCADLKKKDPDAYKTDVLAEFRDPESALYSSVSVDAAMARQELSIPPEEGKRYTAAIDPGTRGNAWTFGLAETEDNVRFRVVHIQQWIGSSAVPLKPSEVFAEMRPLLEAYGCSGSVKSDQWSIDALRELALLQGIGLSALTITSSNKTKLYESIKVRLNAGLLSLPPDPVLRNDLLSVKKRLTADGFKIILPETADGRHCDYAALLALLCGDYLQASSEAAGQVIAGKQLDDDDDVDDETPGPYDWIEPREEFGSPDCEYE